MSHAVLDASVLVSYYGLKSARQEAVADRLAAGDAFAAPAHLDVEVASALRRLARNNATLRDSAPAALMHLASFSIRRTSLAPLLERIWELRHNVTTYDAAYVALAERLSCPLLTCDARLAAVQGTRCDFELIG